MKNYRGLEKDFEEIFEDGLMNQIDGSTVLITGATGMIGALLVKYFLFCNERKNMKITVIGTARNQKKAKDIYGNLLGQQCFKMIYLDIIEKIEIKEKVDYIFHTASATSSKFFVTYPVETFNTMYLGTLNILNLAMEKSVKSMVYLSSMEIYGKTDSDLKTITEENIGYIDFLNIRSSYSEGKRASECLCVAFTEEKKVPVKIARLAQTFGVGIQKEDNRVYAQFINSVLTGQDIVLHTEGKSWGNYCYTSDLVSALLILLLKGKNGEAYNISNEENTMSIYSMASMVLKKFGNNKLKLVIDIPEDNLKYGYAPDVKMCLDSKKIRMLGWKPKTNLQEMYKKTIEYIKETQNE